MEISIDEAQQIFETYVRGKKFIRPANSSTTFVYSYTRNSAEQKTISDLEGYIYLLKSKNGYYKIGMTTDLEVRTKTIMRQYPIEIRRIHYFGTSELSAVEAFLHKLFSEFKMQGEWFRLEKSQISLILSFDCNGIYSLENVMEKCKSPQCLYFKHKVKSQALY